MCRTNKVKSMGRCKTYRDTRCIECGEKLQRFVRTLETIKIRKKQWEHRLYEHPALVKTRTFQSVCVNPECRKRLDPQKLLRSWTPVKAKVEVEKEKTFDEVTAALEQEVREVGA